MTTTRDDNNELAKTLSEGMTVLLALVYEEGVEDGKDVAEDSLPNLISDAWDDGYRSAIAEHRAECTDAYGDGCSSTSDKMFNSIQLLCEVMDMRITVLLESQLTCSANEVRVVRNLIANFANALHISTKE